MPARGGMQAPARGPRYPPSLSAPLRGPRLLLEAAAIGRFCCRRSSDHQSGVGDEGPVYAEYLAPAAGVCGGCLRHYYAPSEQGRIPMSLAAYFSESIKVLESASRAWSLNLLTEAVAEITGAL